MTDSEAIIDTVLIFHIADASRWAAAQVAGTYVESTLGRSLEEVGFIHCSTWAQVPSTAALFYTDVTEPLVVLEIDAEALARAGVKVLWEHANPDDAVSPIFPHIYGALPPACVRRALESSFDAEGLFVIGGG